MSEGLDELWRKIGLGTAEKQEKIDGAVLAGESHDFAFVPRLLSLTDGPIWPSSVLRASEFGSGP